MHTIKRIGGRGGFALLAGLLMSFAIGQGVARAQCTFPGIDLNLTDGGGFTWDVQRNGTISNGTIDAYDVGQSLNVNGVYFPTATATTELAGRQSVHGPTAMSGLNVTRRVYVPATERWARFLESFQNPTGAPITVTVRIETNAGSDNNTNIILTSSGDQTYTVGDRWLVTDDVDSVGDPTLTHNFWGANGALMPNAVGLTVFDCAATPGPFAQFSLTVPAGATRTLMHLASQNSNQAAANLNAAQLDSIPPSILTGMSLADQSQVLNWPLTCGNGVIDAGEQCDDGNLLNGDCCSAACQFEGTNPGCSPAADIFPNSSFAGPSNNWVVGWSFTPSSDITVTALGMTDMPPSNFSPPVPSDGLLDPHQVGIWTASQTLLVSTTVPAGTGSLLVDNIRYMPVPATVLTAGNTYVIGAFLPQNDGTNDDVVDGGIFNWDPRLTFVQGRRLTGAPGFVFPTTPIANPQFGPSFLFNGRCGDGALDGGETCDDHNTTPNDGCDASCHVECGNGAINGSEACDDGNLAAGDCCSPTCTVEPMGTPCRAAAGVCDAPEVCTGSSPNCPADGKLSGLCRAAVDTCDAPEVCNGVSNDCPFDGVQLAGTVCRGVGGDCDVQESCDGVSTACPADAFLDSSTTCRLAAGVCDFTEQCTGSDAACPPDLKRTDVCRSAADLCDAVESCDGVDVDCPADALEPPTTVCRGAADACDEVENCTGAASSCPTDLQNPDSDGDTVCDAIDPCTNLDGILIGKPRVVVRKLLTPTGDDRLRFSGQVLLPVPFTPALDPVVHGARVVIEDALGATVADATIPPGAYVPATKTGWKVNAAGNRWTYINAAGVNGFVRVVIKDKSSKTPGLVKFAATGRNGSFPVAAIALHATIVLDAPTAQTGQCGENGFPGPLPHGCFVKAGGDKVLCK